VRRFDASTNYSDTEIENFKAKWRGQHGATVRFWHGLENVLRRVLRSKKQTGFGNLSAEAVNNTLYLTLPSGRRLVYPEARLVSGKHPGTMQIVFKDNARCGWSDQRGWFGTFAENVVQAVARDLLAAAMLRLEVAGYAIVLHVHDEIVAEVPEGFGSDKEFGALMTALPDWATGLPLAAKTWSRVCYAKPAVATPISSASAPPPAPKGQLPAIVAPRLRERSEDMRLGDLIGQPLVNGKVNCPFHADDTPSLHFFHDHFYCFGCGARGDHVDWLMIVEGKNRAEAERMLKTWKGSKVRPRQNDNERTLAFARRLWIAADRWHAGRPLLGGRAWHRRRNATDRRSAALSSALSLRPRCAPSLFDRALH
jgi:hypothetical protein